MLAAARNHLRPPRISRRGAAELSTKADQEEGKKKSTWTKIQLFSLPISFFCAGTERVFSFREKTELAKQWEKRLKMEVLKNDEINASSSESLKSMEFRKVQCKGVFDEKKMILVVEDTPSASDPFAYEYSLITPLVQLHHHHPPQSILVNRGRVPRDWADYRKIEKFHSHEIVRDFPQKEHLSSVTVTPQPVGIIRNIILRLQKYFSSAPRHVPRTRPVEFVGVIRSGVCSEWLSIDVGTLARAVGLDPDATLYVEQIEGTSDGSNSLPSTVATPYHDADMLARFTLMRKDHIEMMIIWYYCSVGTLFLARWFMRKPL